MILSASCACAWWGVSKVGAGLLLGLAVLTSIGVLLVIIDESIKVNQ